MRVLGWQRATNEAQKSSLFDSRIDELEAAAKPRTVAQAHTEPHVIIESWSFEANHGDRPSGTLLWKNDADTACADISGASVQDHRDWCREGESNAEIGTMAGQQSTRPRL